MNALDLHQRLGELLTRDPTVADLAVVVRGDTGWDTLNVVHHLETEVATWRYVRLYTRSPVGEARR